jgi:transposase
MVTKRIFPISGKNRPLLSTPDCGSGYEPSVYNTSKKRRFDFHIFTGDTRLLPIGKVARELDIHPNLLHLWRRRFLAQGDKAFVGKGRVTPEEAEIKGLWKQLEKVRQERDILKKALAVFSKQNS